MGLETVKGQTHRKSVLRLLCLSGFNPDYSRLAQVKLASICRRIAWFAASLVLSVRVDTVVRSEGSKSRFDCSLRCLGLPSGMCFTLTGHDLRHFCGAWH